MHNAQCRHAAERGFTLIEAMIVVAVIGILSMIAMPSYRAYVIRGNIPEATTRLSSRQVQMEQHFQDSRSYVGGPGCVADTLASKVFDFSCSGVTATAYTMSAVGKGTMAGFTYRINEAGAKSTVAVPSGWSQPSPNNCWVTKKGGMC